MRSMCLLAFVLVTVTLFAGDQVFTQQPVTVDQVDVAANESPEAWFVELQGAPVADGGTPADLAAEKAAFRAAARSAGIVLRERYAYEQLWNGLSVEVSDAQLAPLTRLPQVRNIYPVISVALPETTAAAEQPELSTAVAMTQADIAQADLGLTGHGIRVAIMDSGIDFDHPDLGGCFGPGCRVEVGWDFVGDTYNNDSSDPAFNPVPTPDPIPDDCNGHGTHVAGIAGANGVITGVAPGVTFAAYRVFGCAGSTSADIMIAAMERALQDGADILNMSIGSAFQWPNYPTAQAADRLVNKGVVVVASAGNSGASGAWAASAPSLGHKVISVASFQNSTTEHLAFTVTPDGRKVGYNPATGAAPAPIAGAFPMARTGTTTSTADACLALPAGSLTGKIALIRRGTCTFHVKTLNAQNAGAAGVVLYNNAPGIFAATVVGSAPIVIPVVTITDSDGALINTRLAAGSVTMTWTAELVKISNPTGNLIAGSSSYGMSPDLSLKPDLGAPGAFITSTYPLEKGGYANLSGTSMSSPHVAGAVALLLEARPHTPSQAVRTLLQNTAAPRRWFGNPASGLLEATHRQGAGMLQIADAVQAAARVEPGKLSLGEYEAGATPRSHTLTIENDGNVPVTYQVSHTPAVATVGTFTVAFFNAPAQVTLTPTTVTVAPGGSATIDVTITPNPALPDRAQYGGWVEFTPDADGQTLRVPYVGFKGDYQSIPVLVPTPNGFPWLASRTGSTLTNQPTGKTYTMSGTDIPYFPVHLDHQSRELRLDVFDADTGKAWHGALRQGYVPRNSGAATFFTLAWDGETRAGNRIYTVPNGRYVVRMTVIKALGDPNNPAHTESWTSPVITIARP